MRWTIRLARASKRAFVALGLRRVVEPLNPIIMRVGFMARQATWCADHPAPFTDDGAPGIAHDRRYLLYEHLFASESLDRPIEYLEFGVARGESFNWWLKRNGHPESRFVGFDTFTGLPERYGLYDEGRFSQEGHPPDVDDTRSTFRVGLFQDTLPDYLRAHNFRHRKVVHLDADLYSSTLFVLTSLAPHLRPSDILIFDEFGVPTHEFRAFDDFAAAYRFEYEVLGAVNNYLQVALRVT